MILHEAPHKLKETLSDLESALGGNRKISLCRELTKLNEEIIRTTLDEACKLYEQREPRGEYVLVIEGKAQTQIEESVEISVEKLRSEVEAYIDGGMNKNAAIKAVAEAYGKTRNELYDILMKK